MENIAVNLDNLSQEDKALLLKLVDKANTTSKVWVPNIGENYYSLTDDGDIHWCDWDDDSTDKDRLAIGNCFKTQAEANFAYEQCRVFHELRGFAKKENKDGYIIFYAAGFFISHSNAATGEFHFETKEIAQKAIEAIGEERLLKYYFCIEKEEN